jgi:hypothetical protein
MGENTARTYLALLADKVCGGDDIPAAGIPQIFLPEARHFSKTPLR